MIKRIYIWVTLMFVFNSYIYSQEIQKEEKYVDVEYRDHKIDNYSFEHLKIKIASGFVDEFYLLTFYINDNKIKTIECKTDESLSYCLTKTGKFATIRLSHDDYNIADTLKIETKGEYIQVSLRKDYSSLLISRYNGVWKVLFVKGFIEKTVE